MMTDRTHHLPRRATLLALALLAAAALAAPTAAEAAAKIVVTEPTIRLGDLFQVGDDRADTPVARSPAPGRQLSLDRNWLIRLARAHRLPWHPTGTGGLTVERAGTPVDGNRVKAALARALQERTGTTGEVDIFNRNLNLFVPVGKAPTVRVEDVAFDDRSQRFTAGIALAGDGDAVARLRLSGLYAPLTRLPVPRHDIAAGEIIDEDDLTWVAVRESRVRDNLVVDRDGLVGQSPSRRLQAGRVVRAALVGPPILVRAKSTVTMEISAPYMSLTARGVAIDEGAAGDVVRVRNLQSGKTVHAVVVGPDRVAAQPMQQLATNATLDKGALQ